VALLMHQQPIYFLVGIKMKSNVAVTLLLVLSFHSHAKAPIIGGDLVTAGKADGVINFYTTDDEGDLSNSCTGSKIGGRFILTAAHCVYGKNVNTIGWSNSESVDLEDESTNLYGLYVKKVNIHPSYELFKMLGQTYKSSDVAIIEVDTSKGNFLHKFNELPSHDMDFSPVMSGEKIQAYGYGCEKAGDLDNPKSRKKMADLDMLPFTSLTTNCSSIAPVVNQNASEIYKAQMISSTLRSGGKSSLCEGDSGGPTMRNGKIVGVNSQYLIDQSLESDEAYFNLHSRLSEIKGWMNSILR